MSAACGHRRWFSVATAVAALLAAGCSLSVIPQGDADAPPATGGGVLVFGTITYIIDGETKLPYGAFRPSIPPPHLDLLQLESGDPLQSHGVNGSDGSFLWRMQPGHYVISGIGRGQFTDDHRIAWPRLAFEVKAGGSPVYLGHLQLIGTRYAEPYTLSTGTTGIRKGIRYAYSVEDELDRVRAPSGAQPVKSLIVQRPNMPIGQQLVDRWRASKQQVIREIFGP